MTTDNTQGGSEPSPASAGSQPVAWVVALGGDGLIVDGIFLRRTQAEEACAWRNEHTTYGARIIPLYEKPQPALTDAEREAVERAVGFCECTNAPLPTSRQIATIRGLLERTK